MSIFKITNLAGPGYVILNALRVLNIVSLMAAATAFIVMLVKTFIKSRFFFFDGASHVIGASFAIFLIISEIGIFRAYYARNFPLLSMSHGFNFLGGCMIVIGVHILGNLNKEATSQKNLGKSFWQIVIAAGILVSIFGTFNIVASFVFRTRSQDVTARMVRAYGAVAPQKAADAKGMSPEPSHVGSSNYSPTLRSFAPEMSRASTTNSKRAGHGLNISGPMDHAQFGRYTESEDITKPDLAAHPALNGGRF